MVIAEVPAPSSAYRSLFGSERGEDLRSGGFYVLLRRLMDLHQFEDLIDRSLIYQPSFDVSTVQL